MRLTTNIDNIFIEYEYDPREAEVTEILSVSAEGIEIIDHLEAAGFDTTPIYAWALQEAQESAAADCADAIGEAKAMQRDET